MQRPRLALLRGNVRWRCAALLKQDKDEEGGQQPAAAPKTAAAQSESARAHHRARQKATRARARTHTHTQTPLTSMACFTSPCLIVSAPRLLLVAKHHRQMLLKGSLLYPAPYVHHQKSAASASCKTLMGVRHQTRRATLKLAPI